MITSARDITETVYGFQKARALLSGFELGIFAALADSSLTSSGVASRIGADPRATDRLMNALCALGLLEKEGGVFRNAPVAAEHLVRGKPGFIGSLGHSANLWHTWTTLTDAVRAGTRVFERPGGEQGEQWLESFIAAMHTRASAAARAIVAMLDLSGVSRVLDVGGGSGAYAMEFARQRDGLTATVFDLPDVVPLTQGYVAREGLTERVDTVAGDCLVNQLPRGYDLIFLSQLLHSNTPEECAGLLRKCAGSLNPSGQIVIQEFIVNDDRSGPLVPTLFALNMLVGTPAGDAYSEAEVRGWLAEAGIRDVTRKETEFETTLIVGR